MTTHFNIAKNLSPTPKAIWVKNIALSASDKIVQDFFSFCGDIHQFEMKAMHDTQEALILFETETAANTTRLLSNAMIGDRTVQVQSYFDLPMTDSVDKDDLQNEEEEEHRPVPTKVISALLANGYTLSEGIVNRGMALDQKYLRVGQTLTTVFQSAKQKAEALDQQYKVTDKIKQIDTKLQVSENANVILNKSKQLATVVLATPPGQKVVNSYDFAKGHALQVAQDTRALVNEKHMQQSTTPKPIVNPDLNVNAIKTVQPTS